MSVKRVAMGIAVVGSLGTGLVMAGGLTPQQLVDQMSARFSTVKDYEVYVDSTSLDRGKEERHGYRFTFKKPAMIRLRNMTGDDRGGELCVCPNGKIKGRKDSSVLRLFTVSMSRNDKRLVNSEGVGVWETDQGSVIRRIGAKMAAPGCQASVSGPDKQTGDYQLILRQTVGTQAGITDSYWVDDKTFWINRWERSRSGTVVERSVYTDRKINVGYSDNYFDF